MPKLLWELDQGTSARLPIVPMATMITRRMHARLMATMVPIISSGEYLLARVRGSTASMVAATMADGAGMDVGSTVVEAATTVAVGIMAVVDGMVVAGSAEAKVSMAGEDSMEEASTAAAVAGFTAVAASMEVVAGSTVAAGATGEATGSCYNFLLSHLNGWRTNLPAVFFCFDPRTI